jgi:hypothetical protein
MKRILLLVVGILSALVVAAPAVLAQSNNGGAPQELRVEGTLPAQDPSAPDTDLASLGCDFDLGYVVTGKTKTITKHDGETIVIAPGQYATLTNLESGETVTLCIT